ncbi:RNA polymerase sigma factor [Haloferula chungangensis]|uniref:RNA polymerase sigma factor n=1 Tax=Haloferula chungangensis TaxID=1048331 RepID=A0ABW2LB61_9BACT
MKRSQVERLYEEHAEGIYRFLLSLVRHPEDARDLLQDIFVRVARNDGFLDTPSNEKAFFFKMARNAAIDRSRRLGARARLNDALTDHSSAFAADSDPDTQAFRNSVAAALRQLPDEQHTIVHLKLWEDMTFEQAAEVCSIPPATAASRYRYGIEKLRALLKPIYREITE